MLPHSIGSMKDGHHESTSRQRRSSFESPIKRLNEDTLRLIFVAVARDDPVRFGSLGWIKVSHVSQQWRAIVLQMPQLWARTTFALFRQSAWETVVSRSQDVPLYLLLDRARKHLTRRHLSFASNLLARAFILHCHLDQRWKPEWNWSSELSGRTMEHLRELHIVSAMEGGESCHNLDPLVAPRLLDCLMTSNLPVIAPMLLSLRLRGISSTDRAHAQHQRQPPVPLSHLLRSLTSFPRLANLSLENKRIVVDDVPFDKRVDLKQVRNMFVDMARYDEIVALLEHMQLSPSTNTIVTFMPPPLGQGCARLIHSLREQLSEPSRTTVHIVRTGYESSIAVRIGPFQTGRPPYRRSVVLICENPPHASPDERESALWDIVRSLGAVIAAQISTIIVEDVVAIDKEYPPNLTSASAERSTIHISLPARVDLYSSFELYRGVKTILVSNRARSFLGVLTSGLAAPGETVFPLLKKLVYDFSYKSSRRRDDDAVPIDPEHALTFGGDLVELTNALEGRSLAGHRLQLLILRGPRECTSLPSWRSECCVCVKERDLDDLRRQVGTLVDERQ